MALEITILPEYPPNWHEIKDILNPPKNTLFAFLPNIYNPDQVPVYEDHIEHEKVHIAQQKGFPAEWWRKYLFSKEFRFETELQAFAHQYNFVKEFARAKDLKTCLEELAGNLANNYQLNLTQAEAESKIRNAAKLIK